MSKGNWEQLFSGANTFGPLFLERYKARNIVSYCGCCGSRALGKDVSLERKGPKTREEALKEHLEDLQEYSPIYAKVNSEDDYIEALVKHYVAQKTLGSEETIRQVYGPSWRQDFNRYVDRKMNAPTQVPKNTCWLVAANKPATDVLEFMYDDEEIKKLVGFLEFQDPDVGPVTFTWVNR